MTIIGIPSTRVSDYFVRQVLLNQTQADQRAMFGISMQVSTGRKFQLPSEAPVASMQVMGLQGLLEQKNQVVSNVKTTQSFLSATDTAMSQISSIVSEARAAALGAIGTTATETQRKAAALQVQQALQQLFDSGNQLFRGRYLFGGSDTVDSPFALSRQSLITYRGDEHSIQTYADTGLLVPTNLQGNEVFGAISDPVRGSVDLNPAVQFDTRLASLFGGRGVPLGSIQVVDGTTDASSIVELSGAKTVGDVLSLIRSQAPAGSIIDAEVTPTGFTLKMPAGNLKIFDIGNGTTARTLGIRNENGAGVGGTITSADVNPALAPTTAIADILGARARTTVRFAEPDNDIIFTADHNGTDLNGVSVAFANDVTTGNESADYDAVTRTLTVHVQNGFSEARTVVAAVNAAHTAGTIPFTAQVDPLDSTLGGAGFVDSAKITSNAATAGGAGEDLDLASGFQITNGGAAHTIDVSKCVTVEDLLNTLNGAGAGLLAEINDAGTAVDVRSRVSGADFAIGENGGTTATQLGLRTFTRATRLEDLNHGRGVDSYEGKGNTAFARVAFAGDDNDLLFRAAKAGSDYNGYTITVDNVVGVNPESIVFDPNAKTIDIKVIPGKTTAQDIVTLASQNAALRDVFTVSLAGDDGTANGGQGQVAPAPLPAPVVQSTAGGDENIDFVIHRADGVAFSVSVHGLKTIGEVIDAINNNPVNADPTLGGGVPLVARVAAFGNGIELIDNSVGAQPFTVSRTILSTAAIDLGLVPEGKDLQSPTTAGTHSSATLSSASPTSSLVVSGKAFSDQLDGVTVQLVDTGLGPGNETMAYDAFTRTLTFDITNNVTTVADLVNLSRRVPPPDPLAASLFDVNISGTDGSGVLSVVGGTATLAGGGPNYLQGADVAATETKGLFTSLMRLNDGLVSNNAWEIERSMQILDDYVVRMNFSRAELGARQQGLDVMQSRLEQEQVDLKSTISQEYDVDLVDAVSNLTARQVAYEASLRSVATLSKLTLLNYL